MRPLRTILAIAMLLPFATTAAHLESDSRGMLVAEASAPSVEPANAGYNCCYVWMLGQWWCIPC